MKQLFTLLIGILLTATAFSQSTFVNSMNNGQDPYVIKNDGFYYFVHSDNYNLFIYKSDKLSDMGERKVIWGVWQSSWATRDMWGPQLHYFDGKWYLYYTAGVYDDGDYQDQRTAVLVCDSQDPFTGNWTDLGFLYNGDAYYPGIVPTLENTDAGIDLTPFEMNGKMYGIWAGGTGSAWGLFIAEMENPWTMGSSRKVLSNPTYSFETITADDVNEGAAILKNDGKVYAIYSANFGSTAHYKLGQLSIDENDDPMVISNWTKKPTAVFEGTSDVYGTGRGVFTTSPDGTENWMLYHSKIYNSVDWWRDVRLQKFTFNPDGSPNFGTPEAARTSKAAPSGESLNQAGSYFTDDFSNNKWNNWRFNGWDHNMNAENQTMIVGRLHSNYYGDKAFVRGYNWTDVAVEADLKMTWGTSNAYTGLMVRAYEPGFNWANVKGYYAGISAEYNTVFLWKMDGTNFVGIAAASLPININQNYHLKVEAEGNTFKVYVDGTLYLTTTDNTYPNAGMCGIYNGMAETIIDNVVIQSLATDCNSLLSGIAISGDTTICNGNNYLFNAENVNPNYTKLWSDNTSGSTIEGLAPVGDYTISLTVTDPISSCSTTVYYTPSVVSLPYANIIGETLYCDGEAYSFTAENLGSNTVIWHDGSTTSTLTGVAPSNNYT